MNHNVWEDGFFKIDPECHIIGDMTSIEHFPGVQMWWKATENIMRPMMQGTPPALQKGIEPWELEKSADPENILRAMDKYGVDVACILPESMMDTTGYSSRWCTNGDAWQVVQTHPDRFILEPNLSPIKRRGIKNAVWELEYWMDRGARIFKYYSPEDTYINDPELWPLYKRAEELGAVLCLHTGFSWVPPGKSKYCHPAQLDDVAREFPDLKLVAFHMGYPYTDVLNMVAMGHPNVYLCLSLLVPWALSAPYKFAKILGEAMRFVGPDRIIWGTDSAGYALQIGAAVAGLADFQIPEELQWKYGYTPLSDEDKRKIFGGNLGGLLEIDTTKRRGGQRVSEEGVDASPAGGASVTAGAATVSEEISGVYPVVVSTPIGKQSGAIELHAEGTALTGALVVKGSREPFSNGATDEEGGFSFQGELATPLGKTAYQVTGVLKDGKITAVAKTKLGDFKITSQ